MEENRIDTSNLCVIYVQFVGKDKNGLYVYEFLISGNPDDVWVDSWNELPVCNEQETKPLEADYEHVMELRTDVRLILGQDNCCVSFLDIKDDILAIAFEDITGYDEYPNDGRIVIHYGQPLDEVEEMLARRNLHMIFV